MERSARVVVLWGMVLAAGCGRGAEPQVPAPRVPVGYERVPEVCRETQQRPAPGAPDRPGEPLSPAAPSARAPDAAHRVDAPLAATVRVLSTDPFLFRGIGGANEAVVLDPFPFARHVLRPEAAAKLPTLRFGDVVTVMYLPPPIMSSVPPLVITDVRREPLATTPVPLLVEWLSPDAAAVRVYADGRVVTMLPEEEIQSKLSAAQLRALLGTFARAGFDALPSAPDGETTVAPGELVLDCARHQRVLVAPHAPALAPVTAALGALVGAAKARQSAILVVEQSIPDVTELEWPADAPPLAELERLHAQAHAPGRTQDDPSPLFRPLPPAFAQAYAAGRAPGGKLVWLLRDHGNLWMIGDRACAHGDPVCHDDSLDMVQVDLPVQPAPAWAPELAKIDRDGLFYDRAQDPRWLELHGWYAQGHGLYLVEQRVHTAPAKP